MERNKQMERNILLSRWYIQNKINNLVSSAIFLLYNEMLLDHKKVKMLLGMKCQGKTKSKRCDSAMQQNDGRKTQKQSPEVFYNKRCS